MSDSYEARKSRERRLYILQHLQLCEGYTSNASILIDVLAGRGLRSSHSQVVTDLIWLRDNGFVSLTDHADFIVVTITQAGVEIAQDVTRHPEIARPRPRL